MVIIPANQTPCDPARLGHSDFAPEKEYHLHAFHTDGICFRLCYVWAPSRGFREAGLVQAAFGTTVGNAERELA